jgi:hypothetical protein
MKLKHKIQISFFLISTTLLIILSLDYIFNKKPYRQKQNLENNQRIILPFKQLKETYK